MCKYTKKPMPSKTENIGYMRDFICCNIPFLHNRNNCRYNKNHFCGSYGFSHSPYCIENNPDKDYTSNKHLKLLSDWKLTTY